MPMLPYVVDWPGDICLWHLYFLMIQFYFIFNKKGWYPQKFNITIFLLTLGTFEPSVGANSVKPTTTLDLQDHLDLLENP